MRGLSDGDDMRSSRFDFCKIPDDIVRVAIAQRQVCNCGIQGVMVWSRCIYLVEGLSRCLTIVSFFRDNEEEALSEQS